MSSDKLKLRQTPAFGRTVKKFKKKEKESLDKEIKAILENPEIGDLKKGNLAGIRVHKFKVNKQLTLLSYSTSEDTILLITIGSHENFYRDLKNYNQ